MSLFSRRARWLDHIFPASTLPRVHDPGLVSDDVSLVQPYDGGGHGFADIKDICTRSAIFDGVTGGETLRTVGPGEVFRLYALDMVLLAGVANTLVFLSIIDNEGAGDQVFISNEATANQAGLNPGEAFQFVNSTTIVPPGCVLRVDWLFGAVGTTFTIGHMGMLAPLGSVFYV